MSCKLLQVDIKWWAMVHEMQNSKLRTGLQSVTTVPFDHLGARQ